MNFERIKEKLNILVDATKYDVSCTSSGSDRKNKNKGLGSASRMGICPSYTEDGLWVSLLKILLTNHCIFDCAYCVTHKSNGAKLNRKVSLSVQLATVIVCLKTVKMKTMKAYLKLHMKATSVSDASF